MQHLHRLINLTDHLCILKDFIHTWAMDSRHSATSSCEDGESQCVGTIMEDDAESVNELANRLERGISLDVAVEQHDIMNREMEEVVDVSLRGI